jgi:hypothetical protein
MRHLTAFALLLLATAAIAADNNTDDTEKVLNATRVNDVLRLTLTAPDPKKPGVITYTIDDRHGGVLHDGDTFVTPGAVDLAYVGFNPLKISLSSSQQTTPDPVQAAIDKFAKELGDMAKLIAPQEKESSGKAFLAAHLTTPPASCMDNAIQVRDAVYKKVYDDTFAAAKKATLKGKKRKVLTSAELKTAQDDAATAAKLKANPELDTVMKLCARCEAVTSAADAAKKIAIASLPVTKETVQGWIDDADGRAGVVTVRKSVDTTIELVSQQKKDAVAAQGAAEKVLDDLTGLAGDLRQTNEEVRQLSGRGLETALPNCATAMDKLPQLQRSVVALQKLAEQDDSLLDSLKQLLAVLKTYEAMRWRNDDHDVVFDTVESDPANIKTTKVTVKMITYSFNDDKSTVDPATDVDASRSFDVRRERRLVAEYGVAMLYNDLKYPKYSIDSDSKVKKDFDTSNVNAAATLNFLCGSCIGSGVYPGFQFGLSKAKDYPGLLGGGVLRFGGTNRIAVASGVMVTWYKDLNNLHVGDTATDDKLKSDLKLRRSPAAWYFAVQYTFQ